MGVSGFQAVTLLKKPPAKMFFSANFAKCLGTPFKRMPADGWFLCLSGNFEKFFRTPLLHVTSGKLLIHVQVAAQQTFVLMKTSSRRLDQEENVRLSLTSSEDVFKTNIFVLAIRLQDVFKASSRRIIKFNCSC